MVKDWPVVQKREFLLAVSSRVGFHEDRFRFQVQDIPLQSEISKEYRVTRLTEIIRDGPFC